MSFNFLICGAQRSATDYLTLHLRPGDRVLTEEYYGRVDGQESEDDEIHSEGEVDEGVSVEGWEDPATETLLERANELYDQVSRFFNQASVDTLSRDEVLDWIQHNMPELEEDAIPNSQTTRELVELSSYELYRRIRQRALLLHMACLNRLLSTGSGGRTFVILSKNLHPISSRLETSRAMREIIRNHNISSIRV